MTKQAGLWIDHRKAVIVFIADKGEEVKKIESGMEKHVRFTSEDGLGEDSQDRKFGNHLNYCYDEVIDLKCDRQSQINIHMIRSPLRVQDAKSGMDNMRRTA